MLTIADSFLGRRNFPPFASSHASLVMDLDLTSASGSTPSGIATHGFTVANTPTFDSSGMLTSSGHIYTSNFKASDRAALALNGTIYIEYDRAGVALDNGQVTTYFPDSSGRGDDLTERKLIFHTRDSGNLYAIEAYHHNAAFGNLRVAGEVNNNAFGYTANYMNRVVSGHQDATVAKLVITWNQTHLFVFADGHLLSIQTLTVPFTADGFANFGIGGFSSSATTLRFGAYHIKRVQVTKVTCLPVLLPLRFGLYGDSFIKGADGSSAPASHTVAAIDAVQSGLTLTSVADIVVTPGQATWLFFLQALAWEQLGVYIPYYNAGRQGGGYEKVPIESAYADALNAYRPEIVIAFGSVNDINVSSPVTNIVANVKTHLDRLIDGNTALRKLYFVETFPGYLPPNSSDGPTAIGAEHDRIVTLLRAGGIDGYRSVVKYIKTTEDFAYTSADTIGSAPDNTTSSGPTNTGTDVHLTSRGKAKVAAILWPHFKHHLLSML